MKMTLGPAGLAKSFMGDVDREPPSILSLLLSAHPAPCAMCDPDCQGRWLCRCAASTMPNVVVESTAKAADPQSLADSVPSVGGGANAIPPLEAMLNLHDVEAVAQRVMVASGKKHAWVRRRRRRRRRRRHLSREGS